MFGASCSRGALLEGAFEAEQDAAPARVVRSHVVREAGVTVRANYVALPFAAGRGEDEGGESRPDQGSISSPVFTRKYGPLAKNRRNGAPQGDALPEVHRVANDAGSETRQGAPCGAPCPSLLKGGETKSATRAWRESNDAWLFDSGCLKTESGVGMTRDASMHSIVITGLDPVIHVLLAKSNEGVDGRVKPGHDELQMRCSAHHTFDVVPAKAETHNTVFASS
ncbi:MAG: hypothetical protein Q7V17_09485 [Afipia sp.]|nr:hypothetical protein [Afipia sp.]